MQGTVSTFPPVWQWPAAGSGQPVCGTPAGLGQAQRAGSPVRSAEGGGVMPQLTIWKQLLLHCTYDRAAPDMQPRQLDDVCDHVVSQATKNSFTGSKMIKGKKSSLRLGTPVL